MCQVFLRRSWGRERSTFSIDNVGFREYWRAAWLKYRQAEADIRPTGAGLERNPNNQVAKRNAQSVGVGGRKATCGIWSSWAPVEACGLQTGSSGHFPVRGSQAACKLPLELPWCRREAEGALGF